jgi:RNA polymerase sigma factor (sigma-70 family)
MFARRYYLQYRNGTRYSDREMFSLMDFFQEAAVKMCEALPLYEPTKGSVTTYLYPSIRHRMWWVLGYAQCCWFQKYFTHQTERLPEVYLFSEMGMYNYEETRDTVLEALLEDKRETDFQAKDREQVKADAREYATKVTQSLPGRTRMILVERAKGVSLQALANQLGVSKERVRQIEERALDNLRERSGGGMAEYLAVFGAKGPEPEFVPLAQEPKPRKKIAQLMKLGVIKKQKKASLARVFSGTIVVKSVQVGSMRDVSGAIRSRMVELGMNIAILADRAGVSKPTVYRALRGKSLSMKSILALARALFMKIEVGQESLTSGGNCNGLLGFDIGTTGNCRPGVGGHLLEQ